MTECPTSSERELVLTMALVNAARELGIADSELSEIVGVSVSTISDFRSEKACLIEGDPAFEASVKLISIYRDLVAVLGSDGKYLSAWFHANNADLGDAPVNLASTADGISIVLRYLNERS